MNDTEVNDELLLPAVVMQLPSLAVTDDNLSWIERLNYSFGNEALYHANTSTIERIVSMMVPVFFGFIGLAGLLGNSLVVIGKS